MDRADVPFPPRAHSMAPLSSSTATHTPAASPAGDHAGRAIEITATMSDSLVAVKHLVDPRSGKPTRRTWALLAAGILLLGASALAFRAGVVNAAHNQAARDAWVQQRGQPLHTFRPARIGLIYDWMAFGGAAGGLLALALALARLRDERQSPCYRIGTARHADFPLELPRGRGAAAWFPLVAPSGDAFAAHAIAGMDGELRLGAQTIPLAALQAHGYASPSPLVPDALQIAIPAAARLRLTMGNSAFTIASVPRPRRQRMSLVTPLERRIMVFVGASAAVHLAIVLLLQSMPPAPQTLVASLQGSDGRLVRLRSVAHEQPRADDDPRDAAQQSGAHAASAAMALREHSAGRGPGGENGRARPGTVNSAPTGASPHASTDRARAIEQARTAGFLRLLQDHPSGAFTMVSAAGHFPDNLEDAHAYAGMPDAGTGSAYGQWGFGQRGSGLGNGPGNGPYGGTIGSGSYGTIDGRGWLAAGSFPGPSGPSGRNRRPIAPQVHIGKPVGGGDMDKNILRRYVRKHLPRIGHCYERELQLTPDIAGTVDTAFQISPRGAVLGVTAHGVHENVASCVAGVIQGIQFPANPSGSLINVRYPFTFRQAGS